MTRFRANHTVGIFSDYLWHLRFIILIGTVIYFVTLAHAQVPPRPGTLSDTTLVQDSLSRRNTPLPGPGDSSTVRTQRFDLNQIPPDTSKIPIDNLEAREDTSLKTDTSKHYTVYLDSTARIAQFVYHRNDKPMVEVFPGENYSLFLDITSPAFKRELQLDSAGQFVTVREMINGLDVKVPMTLTLDDYIHQRYEHEIANNWRELVKQYTVKQDRDQLAGVLGSLTNISIPVPANPLMSIFGSNDINLHISGGVDIRGAFRNTTSDQSTISRFDQTQNVPDFNQNVQINVNGNIGEKLNILADWNTQRTFEYENQLKIKYTGYDDEIIQSIEAGNVSLQTPSLIGGGQALFGIKAKMQTGPLTLTTLLSQKKGQTKEFTVSGGSTSNDYSIQPQDYSKNHYFVDTTYIKFYEVRYQTYPPTWTTDMSPYKIIQMDVFLSVSGYQIDPSKIIQAKAYIDLGPHSPNQGYTADYISQLDSSDGKYYSGKFIQLDPTKDYKYDELGGYISLLTSFDDKQQAIAVKYTIEGGGGLVYGSDSLSGGRILKLVKPQVLSTHHKPAWNLMMKNFYRIVGATNLKKEGFELKVLRRIEGAAETEVVEGDYKLLNVLGLDRFNTNNEPNPDNVFDFIPTYTIDVDRGEIIFPTLRPFDSTIVRYFRKLGKTVNDSLLFSDVYDTTVQAAQYNSSNNKYTIKVKAAGAQSSVYKLGFNLVEGSVRVLLNGSPLTPNVDYTVDYIVGEVVLRKPEALLPGANVQVKYEQNDLFQIASKTLIGARGEVATIPNTTLGFTIMNLNQATLSDKVRIGEEPTNNMMLGVDASTSMNLPFLTNAIDALPLIRTREMSTLRFGGEAAYMIPDPNTKKSTISGDGGASIAYIDDFEGIRRTIPLPITYTAWTLSSAPIDSLLGLKIHDTIKAFSRARLEWFNRLPTDVVTSEIWPQRNTRAGQNQVTVLNLDYFPSHRGTYNFSPNLDLTLHRENIGPNSGKYYDPVKMRKNWNGVMRYVGTTAGDILNQNVTYLEIWLKATSDSLEDLRSGRLYIDLGRISEDVIPNGIVNSEDLIHTKTNPQGWPTGTLQEGADRGLDTLDDQQEKSVYAGFLSSNNGDPDVDGADPSGDDWQPYGNGLDLSKFNGTEGNKQDPAGLLPNTEDLNGNGEVDLSNQYLEYELPLDTVYTDSMGVQGRKNIYRVGGGTNGWYQFRIPLLEATRVLGSTSRDEILKNVQFVRMWVSGFARPVSIRIAELDLIGNQWQERTTSDSLLKVSVVNIEDNPEYAADWASLGIAREKDRSDPNQIIEGNEQSLALILNNLPKDSTRQAVKPFVTRPLDLFNYKSMKMFVHGDKSFSYISPEQHDADIFIRFGSDSLNFYEYRQPIHNGWDVANNQMNIVFSQLTSVKAERDSVNRIYKIPVINGPEGATYGVRGNPSLRQIREISIGIVNVGSVSLRGQVWANELRLVDVDNSPGVAYRFDMQMKLADLGSFSFNFSRTDPNFHGLDQRFGNQTTGVGWGVNAGISLEKFFPPEWQGTSIPFGYSHSENISKPKYLPGTDIVVSEAAARSPALADKVTTEAQSLSISDSYSISNLRIVPPSQAWYIRDTFSKLSLAFNYNPTHSRDPATAIRKAWRWDLRLSYAVNFAFDLSIQPFKNIFNGMFLLNDYKEWKLYLFPLTSFSGGISGQRSRSIELARAPGSTLRESRNFGVNKNVGFGWKLTEGGLVNIAGDYGLSMDRNLIPLDNDTVGRDFYSIMKSLFFGGRDNRYSQRVSFNFKPKIPNVLDIPKYFDLSSGYSVNYNWANQSQQGDFGKGASFDNNISLSMTFRLKALTDPWFASSEESSQLQVPGEQGTRRDRLQEQGTPDTTIKKESEKKSPADTIKSKGVFPQLKPLLKALIKIPFLDYETISITYAQANRSGNGGIIGSTGFKNFWGRVPFQGSLPEYGPSRLYQLGLISDPSGTLRYASKSKFPFFGFLTEPGPRPPNTQINDQYSQSNNITLKTNRPLWEGATLEINWKVGWQYSTSTSTLTDSLGRPTPSNPTTSGSIERSFLTIPPVLFFKVFRSNLEEVGKKYNQKIASGNNTAADMNRALTESFEDGLEAIPFLKKVLGPYVPRPNWMLRWDGIEKLAGLGSFMERLSLEHSYSSSIRRDFRGYQSEGEKTDLERVTYGFSPLAGINATFKKVLKGNMTGNFRYTTTTSYDLNITNQPNIVEVLTKEMSLTLSYSRTGFSFPLFGLTLSNDVEVSFTYSSTRNSRRSYDPQLLTTNIEGTPMEGSTRTTLEPRIRYVLSSRVTAALFYRYSKIAPDEGGSRIFGTTTNEAGVDIHISI